MTQNHIRSKKNSHIVALNIRLFSVTSLKHYPYIASSDFHKPKHLYSWKPLLRCEKSWPAIADAIRANVDVVLTLYRDQPAAG